ncbi:MULTISPECIES: carbamoyl-phosphate synthase large subunit [Atopobiaceae]|uniref:Carbamoyl phosphate synthase large chain n=1 Tax=Parafannyhessea umbonata TaxID=604330 RepID=A0A1H9NX75_9ACTN|nr:MULTISPECIES: carbamoyl-phosphate synthase large subunit [Atopobiaceae]SEH70903.1 carbamoyl-phosphate synthase large subunit [Parafannyhessea umbonata]SER40644.1 carbamoyl-phosphate synthase large subunit [Parafannyhessea umbonata]SJZ53270.1 carbamoyl-phosphate synthase large subunit [Olsenella sp. KH1P3]
MPKREDIKKILVIGSGPIVIGQACEFDYSGTQACRALRGEGFEVVLVNSNPATIMTDPETADRTYVEPITVDSVTRVIERERPDALLPNMGGQTALNCAIALGEAGVLDKYGVEVIGCDLDSIKVGEDRELFAAAMKDINLDVARADIAHTLDDAKRIVGELGYPVVIRPSFTLGGAGGGIAHDEQELFHIVSQGLQLSPEHEVLVEESIEGWKEIEMEVMRDSAGNGIVICSIENLDPMGVHTGDSITVAPAQTLTDVELQRLRDYSIACLERVGVATGGSNVQFAVNPNNGRIIVIEMNPRVSRSSALASKATGFPIAKAAALLAVGYTLDEITNDITRVTPACFEPSIDYCVVKIPRFAFEKFKGSEDTLTTRMKAVGEVMAIGHCFEESLQKAMRSLEQGHAGLGSDGNDEYDEENFDDLVSRPTPKRILYVAEALRRGWGVERVHEATRIDRWFLERIADIVYAENNLREGGVSGLSAERLLAAKQMGFSDVQIAHLTGSSEEVIRALRGVLGVMPVVKTVDTCAGEFAAETDYHYLTYEKGGATEHREASKPRAMILSAGPNRIGQGIEFDYCCVHAAYALEAKGYETVMVNCNPETVSTDYDTSDRLYFEPLTFEDVMNIVEIEKPAGVIVTLGGQTPINLAKRLKAAGVPIMGTQPEAIDLAEDRERFSSLLDRLEIGYPPSSTAETIEDARKVARVIGYPLLVRPSYVLGGRGMAIVYNDADLKTYMAEATQVSPDHPVYLDAFLEDAIELDVDALCDNDDVYVGSVLEHIEECGIHSGDSACCFPPFSLSDSIVANIRDITRRLALAVGIKGLLNVQYAVKDEQVYVIELNPRASRTVPFSSKATGVPLARMAVRIMEGEKICDLRASGELPDETREIGYYAVKEAVMPWSRFPGADSVLGPEMKSTGEVMGIAKTFPEAYAKTREAIDYEMPGEGAVFVSVCDRDKRAIAPVALAISGMGYDIVATAGTAKTLAAAGIPARVVKRVSEGHPNVVDLMASGDVSFVINTPHGHESRGDGAKVRSEAVNRGICCVTALSATTALVQALAASRDARISAYALQDLG